MKHASRTVAAVATVLVVAAGLGLSACSASGSSSAGKGVALSCDECSDNASDPFQHYRYELALAFNKKYAGKYNIEFQPNVVGAGNQLDEAFTRLAIAGQLPDLFLSPSSALLKSLNTKQKLMNMKPVLDSDPALKASFYPGILNYMTTSDGELLGIPEQRDPIAMYYNKKALDAIHQPVPTTWASFLSVALAEKKAGYIPIASDGGFVTWQYLSELIGTQPGGAEYLNSGKVAKGDFQNNELWVKAVEYLKNLFSQGLTNSDAFTGNFQNASSPFLSGQAGVIADGPWFTSSLSATGSAAGLAKNVDLAIAPGNGVVIFGGDTGWASGASTPTTQKAVAAFVKFDATFTEQAKRTAATGSFGPVKGTYTSAEKASLNATNVEFAAKADAAQYTFPAVQTLLPSAFQTAWQNYWPAYAQGSMSTSTFLSDLSSAAQ